MASGFLDKQILQPMSFKTYKWSNNPAKCSYVVDRTYVMHKYPENVAIDIEDMEPNYAVITGEGEFFGDDAYDQWNELNNVFHDYGVGAFYHPIYTDVKQALFTKLQSNLEPREDYVSYTFEFMEYKKGARVTTPKSLKTKGSTKSTKPSKSKPKHKKPSKASDLKIGQTIYVTGHGFYTSYGAKPQTSLNAKREKMKVGYLVTSDSSRKCPVGCKRNGGDWGWVKLSQVEMD
jgi:hypothetical protein